MFDGFTPSATVPAFLTGRADIREILTRGTGQGVSVVLFGATGNGVTDDRAAIQAAIDYAVSIGVNKAYLPAGRYRVANGAGIGVLNIATSGFTLEGAGPSASVLVYDHPSHATAKCVLLVQGPSVAQIADVTIRGIGVELADEGGDSLGAFQVNNCTDFLVERCHVTGDGTGMGGSLQDGFVVAYPSSRGVFAFCRADGLSKAGFYASAGADIRFVSCVAVNTFSTALSGMPGMSVGAADLVTFLDCHARGNQGAGLLIGPLGSGADQQPTEVTVLGGHFDQNDGSGIAAQTSDPAVVADKVSILGASCCGNAANGVNLAAVKNVLLEGVTASGNVVGIALADIAIAFGEPKRTTYLMVSNCQGIDNSQYGLYLSALDEVVVAGGRWHGNTTSPIAFRYTGTPPGQRQSSNVHLLDPDVGTSIGIFDSSDDTTPQTGYFRVSSASLGAPEGVLRAPVGSDYRDLATGLAYHKETGYSNTGWRRVMYAKPLLATGAAHTVDDVIAALQAIGLVRQV